LLLHMAMSYIVHQKIRGKVYAYEAEGYWDSEKKQARQKRKYLGVVDENGNIIPKTAEREIKVSKTLGQFDLLLQLAEQEGLRARLAEAFGEGSDLLLALAIARTVDPTSQRNLHLVLEESFLPELLGLQELPGSQRLSELLASLGRREAEMRELFRSLASKEDALVFDITSLSSYSRQLPFLEYGADYRETGLPQINLGLVVSLQRHLPLYFKIFPGSITDVVTLKNLVAEMQELGVRKCMFVLDRGFYSLGNLQELGQADIDFIMPLPFGKGLAKELLSESNQLLEDPDKGHMLDKELYFVHETKVELAGRQLNAFLIMSEKRRAEERRTLFSRLEELEKAFAGKRWHPGVPGELAAWAHDLQTCLEASDDVGKVKVERKRNAISQLANRCGKTILLTSRDMSWQEALAVYRQRDEVETDFDQLKNDLQALPLRVAGMATLQGQLFVLFLSLLLRSFLLQRARDAKLLGKLWTEEMLRMLGMLKVTQIGQVWRVNEVTKKQRELFEVLGAKAPSTASPLVIKKPGV
jgi:transposase